MSKKETEQGEEALRRKLGDVEADLQRVLKVRRELRGSIEELEEELRERAARDSDLAAQEGSLRGQIGELRRALEAFEKD